MTMSSLAERSEVEPKVRHDQLDEIAFDQLTCELIDMATPRRTSPCDALAALAKALGTLLAFAARREKFAEEKVLRLSQDAVADYARAAAIYMRENANTDPARSEVST